MQTRNVVVNGQTVAVLNVQDDISDADWARIIDAYQPKVNEQAAENAVLKDERARNLAKEILAKFKLQNRANGITLHQALWVHDRMRAASVTIGGVFFTVDVMNMAMSGDIELAYTVVSAMTPDDMSQSYHWVSTSYLTQLATELGKAIQSLKAL